MADLARRLNCTDVMPGKTINGSKARWNKRSTRNENWAPQLYPSSAGCRSAPAGAPLSQSPLSREALQEANRFAEVDSAPFEKSTSTCCANGGAEAHETNREAAAISAAGDGQSCSMTTPTPQAKSALPAEEAHASENLPTLDKQGVDASPGQEEGADAELFFNTCSRCGETLLLIIDGGSEFVCEEAGATCSTVSFGASLSDVLPETQHKLAGADLEHEENTHDGLPLRIRLMQRVMAENLTALATADLFLTHGEQPPRPEELEGCREDIQRQGKERKAREKSEAAYQATKAKQNKQQKYVDGQLVDVQKGSRYVVEPKETAAERAKTSLSLVIQGSHRGGNGQKKEKKGPRS